MKPAKIHMPGTAPLSTACGKAIKRGVKVAAVGEVVTCQKCVKKWCG